MAISADQAAAMAFLSFEAYDNSYFVAVPAQPPIYIPVTAQENLNGSGWIALSANQLGLAEHFFNPLGFFEVEHTQALVAIKGNTLALAIRGSDDKLPPNEVAPLVRTDFPLG